MLAVVVDEIFELGGSWFGGCWVSRLVGSTVLGSVVAGFLGVWVVGYGGHRCWFCGLEEGSGSDGGCFDATTAVPYFLWVCFGSSMSSTSIGKTSSLIERKRTIKVSNLHDTLPDLQYYRGEPVTTHIEPVQANDTPRRPRILLAASGSVVAIKFEDLCHCFSEWADVKAVTSKSALHFINNVTIPEDLMLYTDEDEWSSWSKIGGNVLHIELRRWADIMVIAPLSANTLGKVKH
uniref:phosphopantothenoylcysteine decarboxylase n=1 Tax=Chenopodium quinoa TaxID=63459 RepID=A0A803MZ98_CHEQI